MKKIVWKATVLPGMIDEYINRHNNIWCFPLRFPAATHNNILPNPAS